MTRKAVYAVVSGIVQGVGFRYFTQRKAARLGLAGFVRNLPDGGVEVYMEGNENDLYLMLNELSTGPSGSRVDNLQTQWEEPSGSFSTFSVRF